MMRTAVAGMALLALTAAVAPAAQSSSPAPKPSASPKTVADAPADEYFGPFKYSALSTRTKIDALARSYRERWTDDASIVHDALMVQSSLEAWAQRYPKDRWLAPTAFHLAQLYMNVQTTDARDHARSMFAYVAKTFPNTKEAHAARLRLRQGFPALHPESPVSATPSPYGPRPWASGMPEPAGSPAPGATGVPSPAASTAPVAPPPPASTPVPAASAKPG